MTEILRRRPQHPYTQGLIFSSVVQLGGASTTASLTANPRFAPQSGRFAAGVAPFSPAVTASHGSAAPRTLPGPTPGALRQSGGLSFGARSPDLSEGNCPVSVPFLSVRNLVKHFRSNPKARLLQAASGRCCKAPSTAYLSTWNMGTTLGPGGGKRLRQVDHGPFDPASDRGDFRRSLELEGKSRCTEGAPVAMSC